MAKKKIDKDKEQKAKAELKFKESKDLIKAKKTPLKNPTNYSLGGINMSKEDYDKAVRLREVRTKTGSKQLDYVSDPVNKEVQRSNLFEAQQGRATAPQINAILQEERRKNNTTENLPDLEVSSSQIDPLVQGKTLEERQQLLKNAIGLGEEARGQTRGEMISAQGEVVSDIGKTFLGNAARLIDSVRAGITGGKSTPVKKAEATFSDATSTLRKELDAVKLGEANPEDIRRDYDRAIASIVRLEEETKLKGKTNVNYWIDSGAELEATIANEKAILEDLRSELNEAMLRQRVGI